MPKENEPEVVVVEVDPDEHFFYAADSVRLSLIWDKLKQIEKLVKK